MQSYLFYSIRPCRGRSTHRGRGRRSAATWRNRRSSSKCKNRCPPPLLTTAAAQRSLKDHLPEEKMVRVILIKEKSDRKQHSGPKHIDFCTAHASRRHHSGGISVSRLTFVVNIKRRDVCVDHAKVIMKPAIEWLLKVNKRRNIKWCFHESYQTSFQMNTNPYRISPEEYHQYIPYTLNAS